MAGSPEKYNACIRELAAHLKEAKRKGGMDEKKRLSLPFVIEKSPYARDSNPWFYEAIFMSDEVDPSFRLRESVTVEGMGIPLAGLAPRGGSRPHANVLKDNGNVHTLTAILDFDRMVDGKPTLRTIPRLMNEHIFIGKIRCGSLWRPIFRPHRSLLEAFRRRRNGTAGGIPPQKGHQYDGALFFRTL